MVIQSWLTDHCVYKQHAGRKAAQNQSLKLCRSAWILSRCSPRRTLKCQTEKHNCGTDCHTVVHTNTGRIQLSGWFRLLGTRGPQHGFCVEGMGSVKVTAGLQMPVRKEQAACSGLLSRLTEPSPLQTNFINQNSHVVLEMCLGNPGAVRFLPGSSVRTPPPPSHLGVHPALRILPKHFFHGKLMRARRWLRPSSELRRLKADREKTGEEEERKKKPHLLCFPPGPRRGPLLWVGRVPAPSRESQYGPLSLFFLRNFYFRASCFHSLGGGGGGSVFRLL